MRVLPLLIVAVCLVLVSCDDSRLAPGDIANDPVPELIYMGYPGWGPHSDVDSVLDLDRVTVIDIGESGSPPYGTNRSEPFVMIHQFTATDYGIYNMAISNKIRLSPYGIQFKHEGVLEPTIKADAFGPAQNYSLFEMRNGIYRLSFENGAQCDQYQLEINDSAILLNPTDISYTRPAHTVYWRLKPQSMTVGCYMLQEDRYLCDELVDLLTKEIGIKPYQYPSYGATPYTPWEEGVIPSGDPIYLYGTENDFQRAGELLEKFTTENLMDLDWSHVSLKNWRREAFYSSQFMD